MILAGFQITTDYPPPDARGKASPIQQAMEGMPAGSSFFAGGAKQNTVLGIAARIEGKKFRTQKKANGVRIWRIA